MNSLEAIHVFTSPALIIVLAVLIEADLFKHAQAMECSTRIHKRPYLLFNVKWELNQRLENFLKIPIKVIAVIACNYLWLHFDYVVEKSAQQCLLIGLIEYDKMARKLGLGREIKVGHVLGYNLAVRDQVATAVNHVRDHHYLIGGRIGKLERQLGRFYVISQHNWIL